MNTHSATRGRRHWLRGASLVGLAAVLVAQPALAQEEEVGVEEVVITGSRTIRDGSTAPTPVSVVSMEQLQQSSPKNLVEGLQALPALRGTSSTNSMSQSAARNFAGSFLNLRNLGAQRTLTLVDGRRLAPATVEGSVNFNVIPQSLIKRVDIVTGGASAAYGSDAVAGVVNVILDTEFVGMKGLVQGGVSDKGDNGNYKAELSYGSKLFDDRLHILASVGMSRANPVDSFLNRRWALERANSARQTGIIANVQGTVPNIVASVANGGLNATWNTEGVLHTVYPGGLVTTLNQPSTLVNNAFNLIAKTNYAASGAPGIAGQGYKILPNGQGSVYSFGDWVNTTNTMQGGGDGVQFSTIGAASLLETHQAYGRMAFDVSDKLQIFADGAYAYAHNNWFLYNNASLTPAAGAFLIYEDNPYLQQFAPDAYARLTSINSGAVLNGTTVTPAALTSFISACNALTNQGTAARSTTLTDVTQNTNPQGQRCFRMGKFMSDTPDVRGDVETDSYNFTLGFRSEIFGGYRLSGYWNHGETETRIMTPGSIDYRKLYASANAVANPAVGGVAGVAAGTPVCGILVHGSPQAKAKFAGCQPLNPFGFGNISQAAYSYYQQSPFFDIVINQDVYALDIAGEPFALPAGDLSVAFGIEHRELTTDLIGSDDDLFSEIRANDGIRGYAAGQEGQQGVFQFTNQSSYGGEVKVNEAYTELNVPILADLPLVDDLSLNAAYRFTDYSTSGEVKTWKVGLSYQPNDTFRFRGTISHDIRAPAINELFQGNVTAGFGFNDIARKEPTPLQNPTLNTRTRAIGNSTLRPEEADTQTYGVVFTPAWIPGFTATLDYYDIKIEDAIATQLGNDPIVDCVTRLIQSGCDAINRANGQATPLGGFAPGAFVEDILTVTISYQNLSVFQTKGLDLEMSYRRAFDAIPGMFTVRTLLGYTMENYNIQRPGQPQVNTIGEVASVSPLTGSNPRFRALTTLDYENGPVSVQLSNRFTSSAKSVRYVSGTTPYVEGVNIDDNRVASYTLFDVAARYRFGENTQYEAFLTVNNILDQEPPKQTAWSYLSITNPTVYDTIGRAYVAGLKFRF